METIRFDNAQSSKIVIRSIGGDLRVTGRSDSTFEAQAPERGRMVARQDGDLIELDSRSSCLVFVPEEVALQIESIGGDGRVTGVKGAVTIGTVGGDLTLRRVRSAEVQRVGGDADMRRIEQALKIAWVGGDAFVERTAGEISIESIGGDLKMRRCLAAVQASAGGDIQLDIDIPPGSTSEFRAGGDLVCTLPELVSAKVQLLAGGELHLSGQPETALEDGEAEIVIGSGEANLKLQSGGDLMMKVGREVNGANTILGADFMSDLDASLEEADRRIAEAEARLGAVGLGFSIEETDRIGSEVRRAVTRALRHKRHSGVHGRSKDAGHRIKVSMDFPSQHGNEPTEEEKMSILKMVEAGTISIEEADMLLQALEGKQ
ncbi:MAG: hypothetical protein JXA25_05005 [Anaerolineales bacterium]|nr:hypothetical protein [Anaerolineales bacterium]